MAEANIVSDSEGEAVILNKASTPSKPKQTNARIHWFFTFNNYSSEDINVLLKVFNEICYMYAFQEETGENGTPHLQGVISLKKRGRWTEFGLPKTIHWEKPRNITDCYKYATKEETRTGEVYVLKYTIPYQFHLTEFYDWENEILEIIKTKPDDRKVYWYWSVKGNLGKSTFVKHLAMNHKAVLLTKGKYSDICNLIYNANMTVNNLVIFDLPRNNGNSISYDAIESIKNGMITNMKYETGFICFPSPHILVFANEPPEEYKLSEDRWVIKEL